VNRDIFSEAERAGSHSLRMLADPVSVEILRGVIVPQSPAEQHELTPSGREALAVRGLLDEWLARNPQGAIAAAGDAGCEAVEALADGWASMLLHALAAEPLVVAELEVVAESAGQTAIVSRLEAMLRLAMVERRRAGGGAAAYAPTDWLREGVVPLSAAARLERRHHGAERPPIGADDVRAAFQLALPLLRLPGEHSGACRLVVELGSGEAGATVQVENGRILACLPGLEDDADATCRGDVRAWFLAVIDGGPERVTLEGDRPLAGSIVEGLHARLFAEEAPSG
jgi:DNA-binding HxlR family transcriptional regulator